MVQPNLICRWFKADFQFVTNGTESLLFCRHSVAYFDGHLRFNRELERHSFFHPQQLLEIAAAILDGFDDVSPIAKKFSEKRNNIQKRGLTAGVGANECAKGPQFLINRLEATKPTCLNACEHEQGTYL